MSGPASVSVLMPAHNAERYIGEAIESVLAQTLADFELLVVDDGSSDGTLEIIRRYERGDPRIRCLATAHGGIGRALTEGLAAACHPFLARMDADDRARPDRLEQQVHHLLRHPDCVAVGGQALLIDPEGLPICPFTVPLSHEEIDRAHMDGVGGRLLHGTATFRTDAIRSVGGYRVEFEPAEDFDLSLRLAESGRLGNLPSIALEYRMHAQGQGYRRAEEQAQRVLEAVTDAHRRRGVAFDGLRRPALPRRAGAADFHREWAVNAARSGHVATARKHARRALALDPAAPETWRVAARAFVPASCVALVRGLRAAARVLAHPGSRGPVG